MADVTQIHLTVRDRAIHCDGCESRIATVLEPLPGVLRVQADHTTQVVALTLDAERTSLDEVRARLERAGFATE